MAFSRMLCMVSERSKHLHKSSSDWPGTHESYLDGWKSVCCTSW